MGDPRGSTRETGAALLTALLVAVLLSAIAAALISIAITETLITAGHRHAAEASAAAEAAIERALRDLRMVADWSLVVLPPPVHLQSSFVDGERMPRAPDGRQLDVEALTRARQRDSDAAHGVAVFGRDAPQWRLYAHSSLRAILPAGVPAQPAYVLVWVADDPGDGDADPSRDANGRLLVFADAYGAAGARRSIAAAIARSRPGVLEVLAWRGAPTRLE
jgi:hypothetical protein